MAGIKKFTPRAAKSTKKPIEFEVYDETFTARPHIQGTVVLDFIAASNASEDNNASLIKEVMPFFKAALLDESYERFETLIHSDDKIIEFEDLMEILGYLIQEYTDRPSSSGSGK